MSASELQKAVDKLIKREPGWRAATQPPAKGAKPGKVATGYPASATGTARFAESDYTLRQYWDAVLNSTTDGIFSWEEHPIKSVALEGGDSMTFKQPVHE